MKFSRKLSSLVTSTVLASVVVTSGATTVLAEESDQGIITFTESQDTTSNEDTKVEETKTDEVVTEEGTVEDGTTEKDADAGLIPGDFFYFVEVMQEKIQLALTFNDYKKSQLLDRKSTRLNSSHVKISYAVFCLKKKKKKKTNRYQDRV